MRGHSSVLFDSSGELFYSKRGLDSFPQCRKEMNVIDSILSKEESNFTMIFDFMFNLASFPHTRKLTDIYHDPAPTSFFSKEKTNVPFIFWKVRMDALIDNWSLHTFWWLSYWSVCLYDDNRNSFRARKWRGRLDRMVILWLEGVLDCFMTHYHYWTTILSTNRLIFRDGPIWGKGNLFLPLSLVKDDLDNTSFERISISPSQKSVSK